MSKFTGSKWKKSRHLSFSVLETGDELKKRTYGPGQHGQDRKRKPSEYGAQLLEKQKLKELYGVNERQFRRLFLIAKKEKTVTGLAFFRLLESRLDNIVYRIGFARTRAGARQLVNHAHFTVNGQRVDIPSYQVKAGDVIEVKESSRSSVKFSKLVGPDAPFITVPAWLSREKDALRGTVTRLPERSDIDYEVEEHLIVELYSK